MQTEVCVTLNLVPLVTKETSVLRDSHPASFQWSPAFLPWPQALPVSQGPRAPRPGDPPREHLLGAPCTHSWGWGTAGLVGEMK